MRRRRAIAALAGGLLALPACTRLPRPPRLPVPTIGRQVTLRLAFFDNPAFPQPAPGFVAAVLREAVSLVQSHFGLAVRFEGETRLAIDQAFSAMPAAAWDRLPQQVYGFRGAPGDRGRLVKPLRQQLGESGRSFESLREQARPHLVGAEPPDLDALAEALIDMQLARLKAWEPFFGRDAYHVYPAWLAAAHAARWPWELVVTNQLVASAEYGWMEFEAALRAGVTNGITASSPLPKYGSVSVLTLYPFIGDDPALLAMRDGLPGGGPDAVRWAAALLAHELGHQLFHFAHPQNPACVMRPTPDLRFAAWVRQHDAARCPVGGEKNMVPGSVELLDVRALHGPNPAS